LALKSIHFPFDRMQMKKNDSTLHNEESKHVRSTIFGSGW